MVKLLFLTFLLVGCSLQSRKDQSAVRSLFAKKEYSKALDYLQKSKMKKDKKQRLLYLMEVGILLFSQDNLKEASIVFQEANDLADKLYTKSVREQIISSVLNDNSKTFYGSILERSMLYYYQSLTYYKMYLSGKYKIIDPKGVVSEKNYTSSERTALISRSRASLLAWDTFFKNINRSYKNKSLMSLDLLHKLFAANLHRTFGTRRDKEIAFILYQDSLKALKVIGPTYQSFNTDFEKYNKELKKKVSKAKKIKKMPFKKLTNSYKRTKSYIIQNILSLAKKIRKNKFKRLKRRLKPSKETLASVNKNSNTRIHIELDHIKPLEGKDFSFTLAGALKNIENPSTKALVEGIGVPVLTYFALGPLGLGSYSHHGDVSVYSSHSVGTELTKQVGVEFELPFIQNSELKTTQLIRLYSDKEKKNLKKTIPLSISGALSEMSFINAQEMIDASFSKRSLRIGLKYVTAITASYATYQVMNKNNENEFFAKIAAVGQFVLASKAIKESEKADIRHWTNLPAYMLTSEFELDNKAYYADFIELDSEKKELRKVDLGTIARKGQKEVLFSFRVH